MNHRRGIPWAALALFGALVASLAGSWLLVQRLEREVWAGRLDVAAEHVGARLQALIDANFEAMHMLAAQLDEDVDAARFHALSSSVQERHEGFQALNWVAPDGVIRWVDPEPANRGAVGFDLHNHPVAASVFRRAEERGGLAVTPPLELLQGGWGFATYLAVEHDGRRLGYLNGVFRIPTLLEHCVGPEASKAELVYGLHRGEDLLSSIGATTGERSPRVSAQRSVRLGDGEWTLSVSAAPSLAAARATRVDDALFGVAVVLAGLLALGVHLARRQRAAALLAMERFRVLVENAPEAVVVIDPDAGRFVSGNRRALELFDLAAEELTRVGPADMSPPRQPDGEESRGAMMERLAAAAAGEASSFSWTHVNARGQEIPTEVQLVRLPGRERPLVRGSITDSRERRALEERLHRSQALEAMGQLAGGVAHDFNNLLTAILGAGELLAMRAGERDEERELALEIVQSALRAGELTRQLLAFSRHQVLKPVPLDLNTTIQHLLPMLERLLGERIEVRTDLAPDLHAVVADAGQLELVVLNLAINARDAMPDGGHLTLSTRDEEAPEGEVPEVVLAVHDDGAGIAQEHLERIFHPFFTTKEPGLGTGIGLATVREVVAQAGGRVAVHSVPGQGSTFEVFLPRSDGRPAVVEEVALSEVQRGSGTVLLVEDDAVVCTMARRSLEQAGYRVLSAMNAEDALELADGHAGPIDVLVTDVVLPRMGGPELVDRFERARPEAATLFVSGYSDEPLDAGQLTGGAHEVLAKPFRPSEITRKVAELLVRRRETTGPTA